APDTGRLNVPGATTCRNWPPFICGTPLRCEYVLTSSAIVGDAYASMIATVWLRPSLPFAIAPLIPEAPCSWVGVGPHGAYGYAGLGSAVPSRVAVVPVFFSFQYAEHGRPFTNAGEGGAEWVTSAAESSSPITAVTGNESGTVRAASGACRIRSPLA